MESTKEGNGEKRREVGWAMKWVRSVGESEVVGGFGERAMMMTTLLGGWNPYRHCARLRRRRLTLTPPYLAPILSECLCRRGCARSMSHKSLNDDFTSRINCTVLHVLLHCPLQPPGPRPGTSRLDFYLVTRILCYVTYVFILFRLAKVRG